MRPKMSLGIGGWCRRLQSTAHQAPWVERFRPRRRGGSRVSIKQASAVSPGATGASCRSRLRCSPVAVTVTVVVTVVMTVAVAVAMVMAVAVAVERRLVLLATRRSLARRVPVAVGHRHRSSAPPSQPLYHPRRQGSTQPPGQRRERLDGRALPLRRPHKRVARDTYTSCTAGGRADGRESGSVAPGRTYLPARR